MSGNFFDGYIKGRKATAEDILQGLEYLLELIKDNDDAKVLRNHIEMWEEEYGVKVDR